MTDPEEIEFKLKKKIQKKGGNVPLSQLGFKSKHYYDIQTSLFRRKRRYKCQKGEEQNGKECFMARLTFFIDPTIITNQQLANFKGIKKSEWDKIKQIVYRSRDELYCCICLEKQFVAPQMTSCGHVFCWGCIYMHHYKSFKANNCPVCNQVFNIDTIITCKTIHEKFIKEYQNQIKFSLKLRKNNDSRVYDPQTLEEEINFARIVKITKQGIKNIYAKERDQLYDCIIKTNDEELKNWLVKVLSMSQQKLQKATQNLKESYKLSKSKKLVGGNILSLLNDKANLINFYQESTGKLIFLHPLCDKYLRQTYKESQLPIFMEQDILLWQQTQYNSDAVRKIKQLNHLPLNQEIDFAVIKMKNLLSEALNSEFQKQLQSYKQRKQQILRFEEKQAEILQIKYEKQKQYLKKLKKIEQSQYYCDIKVPTTLNLSQMNDTAYFPSLIGFKKSVQQQQQKQIEIVAKVETKQVNKIIQDQFPELFKPLNILSNHTSEQSLSEQTQNQKLSYAIKKQMIQTKASISQDFPNMEIISNKIKSEDGPKFHKKKIRNRKQKSIDVTDQFFQRQQNEFDDY